MAEIWGSQRLVCPACLAVGPGPYCVGVKWNMHEITEMVPKIKLQQVEDADARP